MSEPGPGVDDLGPEDLLDLAAAELVLGLVPPAASAALAARALASPDIAARIQAWERRLLPLAALVEPVEPPAALWGRLALATGAAVPEAGRAGPGGRGVRFWRGATVAATAVAACLAVFILTRPPPAPGTEVAVLTEFAGPDPVFLVRLGPDGRGVVLTTGKPDVPADRSLELWALRPGISVPESVGLLPDSGRARLPLALPVGTQLLVSQEPRGGSPTRLPTGPVVLRGTVTRL